MAEIRRGILGNREATDEEICEAMGFAVAKALETHKQQNNPVVTWDRQSDRVVIVQPEDIVVSEEMTAASSSVKD